MTQLTPSGYEAIISEALKATAQKWKDKHATLESLYFKALDRAQTVVLELEELRTQYDSVTEELTDVYLNGVPAQREQIEELKHWASDACELLHEIQGNYEMTDRDWHSLFEKYTLALLRRMENP